MAVMVFLFGAVRPLADPDLPMHLAVGEWIIRHRAVPFVEPFAWTARGEPYYAYSWIPQSLFYLTMTLFGHLGLRTLQGMAVVGSGWAALFLARAAGWKPGQAVMLAGCNLIVGAFFVAMLRPQSILLITMPVIWGIFLRVAQGGATWRSFLALFIASAVTANSHLFFPITVAPAVLIWVYSSTRPRVRDGLAAVGAVVCGWLATPYALVWPAVFRHNFARHILYRPPAAITELQPGFVVAAQPPPGAMLLLLAAMLTVPWIVGRRAMQPKEQFLAAVYWSIGLIGFGYAARLFLVWWVLSLLPVGWSILQLTARTEDAPPRLPFRLLGLAACLVIVGVYAVHSRALYAQEGTVVDRRLPSVDALPAERVAKWLRSNTTPSAQGRILTNFSFGSYLTWRLPGYSASIDSRGTVPDSVAAAEAIVSATDRDVPLGPWKSADLAILPLRYRAAAVLDTASGWKRVHTVSGDHIAEDSVALWVNLSWWSKNRQVAR